MALPTEETLAAEIVNTRKMLEYRPPSPQKALRPISHVFDVCVTRPLLGFHVPAARPYVWVDFKTYVADVGCLSRTNGYWPGASALIVVTACSRCPVKTPDLGPNDQPVRVLPRSGLVQRTLCNANYREVSMQAIDPLPTESNASIELHDSDLIASTRHRLPCHCGSVPMSTVPTASRASTRARAGAKRQP